MLENKQDNAGKINTPVKLHQYANFFFVDSKTKKLSEIGKLWIEFDSLFLFNELTEETWEQYETLFHTIKEKAQKAWADFYRSKELRFYN